MFPIQKISRRFLAAAALIAIGQNASARIETPGARSTGPFPSGAVAAHEAVQRKDQQATNASKGAADENRKREHQGKGFHPFAALRAHDKAATKPQNPKP